MMLARLGGEPVRSRFLVIVGGAMVVGSPVARLWAPARGAGSLVALTLIGVVVLVVCAIGALAAICTTVSPLLSMAAEPAAGTLLNAWSGLRLGNLAVAGLAVVAAAVVTTASVSPAT